jgi:hypothetical protein
MSGHVVIVARSQIGRHRGVLCSLGRSVLLNLLLLHIAVNGPKLRADVARMAKAEDASPVVCGHSHVPFAAHDKGVTSNARTHLPAKRHDAHGGSGSRLLHGR